jgi:hypothetical protein
LNPLLGDIDAHVRMMDFAGLDTAVLSSMVGFDQPDVGICRIINDDMKEVERSTPGASSGLLMCRAECGRSDTRTQALRRRLRISRRRHSSELRPRPDAPELRPFGACADLGLYVFIHPLPRMIS